MRDTTPDQHVWTRLPTVVRRNLGFLTEDSVGASPTIPCRLPTCAIRFERERRGGRPKWFHSRKCAIDFRRRRRALDAAIIELVSALRSGALGVREARDFRGELTWLLNVRATYPHPGEWSLERPTRLHSEPDDFSLLAVLADPDYHSCDDCLGTGFRSLRAQSFANMKRYLMILPDIMELMEDAALDANARQIVRDVVTSEIDRAAAAIEGADAEIKTLRSQLATLARSPERNPHPPVTAYRD